MGSLCSFSPFPWRETSIWQNCGCSSTQGKYLDRVQGQNGISSYVLPPALRSAGFPGIPQPVSHAACPEIPAPGPLCTTLYLPQVPASRGTGNWFVFAQCAPRNISLFLQSSAGRHGIATETGRFFSSNAAFHAHLIDDGTTVQGGIRSLNYCCQSKANHAINSTVTQMTNNFKGKENQDFAAYSVLFQETDKGLHILVLSVLHLL